MPQRCFRLDQLKVMGDPHLGKEFVNGVPLARRGERERMQREAFKRGLDPEGAELHICVGDLFHRPVVSLETIMFAAKAYQQATSDSPETKFIVLAGNHDLSRDATRVSALQVFAEMIPAVQVATAPTFVENRLLLIPWSPSQTANEVVETVGAGGASIAVGHWDLDGNGPNLIPTKTLAALGIRRVLNGHVHLPRIETRDGIEIINIGSLQPLAHGEGDELYVTVSLEELKHGDYSDKCVRVRLAEGELLDFQVECLQLQIDAPRRELDLTVDYDETFDLKSLAERARQEAGVPDDIWAKVLERM
jgi:DNA repair exonuclease SbcCD nuclease subunit